MGKSLGCLHFGSSDRQRRSRTNDPCLLFGAMRPRILRFMRLALQDSIDIVAMAYNHPWQKKKASATASEPLYYYPPLICGRNQPFGWHSCDTCVQRREDCNAILLKYRKRLDVYQQYLGSASPATRGTGQGREGPRDGGPCRGPM